MPETYETQKKMFTNYCLKDIDETNKLKKAKADEKIQEIITLIVGYAIFVITCQVFHSI